MPKKRKRPCDETLDEIWIALRKVQRKTGCTTKVLKLTLDAITPFLKNGKKVLKNGKKNYGRRLKNVDQRMLDKAGATRIELHGCTKCDYIFTPSNKNDHCVKCGHPRFNDKGEPNEVGNCFVLSVYYIGVFQHHLCN